MNIPILAYHKIDTQFEWGINTVSPRLFERQIRFLAENGYQTISLEDYLFNQKKVARPIVITFDDAYQSVYRFGYPILKKYGFTATIFVIADYIGKENGWDVQLNGTIDKHLSWDEIRFLIDAGWEIGSHSSTHPDLTRLAHADLWYELAASRQQLEQNLHLAIKFISYPFNRVNDHVMQQAIDAGYEGGCCLADKHIGTEKYIPFAIPRIGVYSIDTLFWFKQRLTSNLVYTLDRLRLKAICFCANGSIYYKRIKKDKKNIAI